MIRRCFLAAALAAAACAAQARPAAVTVSAAGDMTMGDPRARIEVVEYASLTCPHCAHFHRDVVAPFKAKYVDTGKARYTLKEMLTQPAELAAAGFLLARCAGKDRYFAMVDELFRAQGEMFAGGQPRAVLLRIAQGQGLSEDRFTACIGDATAQQALYARVERALQTDGVDSTPTVFVNGLRVAEGEMTFAALEAAIAKARKAKR